MENFIDAMYARPSQMTQAQKEEIDRYIVDSMGCSGWTEKDRERLARMSYRANTGRDPGIVSRTTLTHCYNLYIFDQRRHMTHRELDHALREDMYQVYLMCARDMMRFKKNLDDYTLGNMRQVMHLLGFGDSAYGSGERHDEALEANRAEFSADFGEHDYGEGEDDADTQESDSENNQSRASDPVSGQ